MNLFHYQLSNLHNAVLRLQVFEIRVISAQISQTIKPKKIDFAYFWCKGRSWEVIHISKIFLFCDQYFGFYGGSKFCEFWVPLEL